MVFLVLMVVGLVGLAMMAIPALAGHGTTSVGHGHAQLPSHAAQSSLPREMVPATTQNRSGIARWLPSPRAAFTALALFGAFGNVFVEVFHRPSLVAALLAVIPTLIVDRLAVRPLWNLVFRFQALPSASLDNLILSEAMAVVNFRNGRGIVSTNREGRMVQLRASLAEGQASEPVKVGDRLRIEDVDAQNERVTVSVLASD